MPQHTFDLDFRWTVNAEGHSWLEGVQVDDKSRRRDFLTDGNAPGVRFRLKEYQPFKSHSGLFREFGETAPTFEAMKSFADSFGLLGDSVMFLPGNSNRPFQGETFVQWTGEMGAMRGALKLYEWVREGNEAALSRHIIWKGSVCKYMSDPDWRPEQGLAPGEHVEFATLLWNAEQVQSGPWIQPGDVINPALLHIQRTINKRIEEHTAIRMLWRHDRAELVNVARPKNLLGALWLQFALTIERGSDFRRCAECGRWFELAPGLGRSDKQFCSVRCRVRSHRRRQAESSGEATHDISAERPSNPSEGPPKSTPTRKKSSRSSLS